MPVKNAVTKAENMRGKINPHYSMTVQNIKEICEAYPNRPCDLICCSFTFGYIQGMKAARAEMKRKYAHE